MSSERGFAASIIVVTLPLLISVFAFFVGLQLILKDFRSSQYTCRRISLDLQQSVSANLNSLLQLNPNATRLRVKRKAAERAHKMALKSLNPKAIAATKATLMLIKAQQLKLKTQQQGLIAIAKIKNQAFVSELNNKLRSSQKLDAVKIRQPKFKVKAKPKTSLTPNYYPYKSFSAHQRSHATWRLQVNKILPDWILTSFYMQKSIKQSCAATSILEGKWVAKLKMDK